jgi:predicted Rossmann fold flavoprotein
MDWFEKRGVELKIEDDLRVFPVSDSSEDIAQALIREARNNQVEVFTQMPVVDIRKKDEGFVIEFANGQQSYFDEVVISSGSSGKIWEILENLGHTIVQPVPSLFTFNIKDTRLNNLQGVSVPLVHSKIEGTSFETTGPLLITHWGVSGPGILKLSAIGARKLAEMNYEATIVLNWLGEMEERDAFSTLEDWKNENPKKQIISSPFSAISKRLWTKLIEHAHLDGEDTWANVPHASLQRLSHQLTMFNTSLTYLSCSTLILPPRLQVAATFAEVATIITRLESSDTLSAADVALAREMGVETKADKQAAAEKAAVRFFLARVLSSILNSRANTRFNTCC